MALSFSSTDSQGLRSSLNSRSSNKKARGAVANLKIKHLETSMLKYFNILKWAQLEMASFALLELFTMG